MALLGSSVDPRLFVQDYSGFARAAEIQGQGMANLGAAIGQGIKDFGEARQERKKLDASIKANRKSIESALKLGESLGIDVSSLNPILEQMDDPNTTPMEAAALGQAGAQRITDTLNLGIGMQDRAAKLEQARAENIYKQGMLGAAQTRAAASLLGAQQAAQPSYTFKEYNVKNPVTGEMEKKELPVNPKTARPRDIEANKDIINVQDWYEYKGGFAPDESTSQVGNSMSDAIASAAEMNVGKLSTAKTPGTQGGNVGCADAICRTFEMATGEELVPGGTLSTREMATNLSNDPRFVKVPLSQAQKGDIILTPRKGGKAGHTGIVLDGGKIASNSSKGFAGKEPGTFVQNYTIDSWSRNVAPRNPAETAAYRYIGSQGIDNALSMNQQVMGTPQQQAELIRMGEEGASRATAQNMTQGAVPTEASLTNQQAQPAQPQVRLRSGFVPVRTQGQTQYRNATPEEVATYGTPGQVNVATGEFKPIRPPSGMVIEQTPEGGFRVVQGAGVGRREEQAAKAEEMAKMEAFGLTQDLWEMKRQYEALSASGGTIPALSRLASSYVPGTQEASLTDINKRVTANLAMEKIMSMRRNNPSGAALGGSTSDKDMDTIKNGATSLSAAQTPQQFLREWTRVTEAQLNIVYGRPEQRAKLVKEGKISEQQNKEIEDLYPSDTISAKGELIPRIKASTQGVPSLISPEVQRILDNVKVK